MPRSMQLENGYIVLKIKDIEEYLNDDEKITLSVICENIDNGRRDHGELLPCPCGKVPDELFIQSAGSGDKYAYVSAVGCCGEWEIEFNNNYKVGDESYALGLKAWNEAARAT